MLFSGGGHFYSAYSSEAWRRLRRRLALLRMRLFRLSHRTPQRLIVAPTDLRPIDAFVAEEILEGRFPLAGRELDTNGVSPFFQELPSRAFAARLHSFSWLRHLRAVKTADASAAARTVVNQWLSTHGRIIDGIAWEPDVVATRLIALLSHSPVLLSGADSAFYRRFSRSLVMQGGFLELTFGSQPQGETRLRTSIALAMLSLAIPVSNHGIKRAAKRLDGEIERQILPDGGHVSRNPRTTLDLLLDLLPLRQTYMNLGHDVPSRLISGIDRMYPALRFFRHQDGDLALFNGATSTLANELMSVLRYDETSGQPFRALPHLNYQRMAAGNTVMLVDTGLPPSLDLSRNAHAGCLSFEMSSGRNRFIINAGSPRFASTAYRQMARATAAHSTLVLNETSSARVSSSPYLGPVMISGPKLVKVSRSDDPEGDDRLEASHDGYLEPFGLIHHRHLGLSRNGARISGRDYLLRSDGSPPAASKDEASKDEAVVRFHIHPAIDLIQAGRDSVLLKAADGETWLFQADGEEVLITEDIFFADASGIRSSEQIEIVLPLARTGEVDWQLIRQK